MVFDVGGRILLTSSRKTLIESNTLIVNVIFSPANQQIKPFLSSHFTRIGRQEEHGHGKERHEHSGNYKHDRVEEGFSPEEMSRFCFEIEHNALPDLYRVLDLAPLIN